jgi:hypothetical protein
VVLGISQLITVSCALSALRPLSPLVLSAWESATDLPPLSWETGVQLSAGRVSVSPRESPLIAVQSGTHLARDLAVCGLRLWESVRHAACWPGHFRTSARLCPWSARKGFADRASQQGELFGVNPARLISMRDADASLVCM